MRRFITKGICFVMGMYLMGCASPSTPDVAPPSHDFLPPPAEMPTPSSKPVVKPLVHIQPIEHPATEIATPCTPQSWCWEKYDAWHDRLRAVWGTGKDLWAVGNGGIIVHFDGATWTKQPVPKRFENATLVSIWGSGPTDIWVGDDDQSHFMLHFDGVVWSEVDTHSNYCPLGYCIGVQKMIGRTANDVYGLTSNSQFILHWDGRNWNAQSNRVGFIDIAATPDQLWMLFVKFRSGRSKEELFLGSQIGKEEILLHTIPENSLRTDQYPIFTAVPGIFSIHPLSEGKLLYYGLNEKDPRISMIWEGTGQTWTPLEIPDAAYIRFEGQENAPIQAPEFLTEWQGFRFFAAYQIGSTAALLWQQASSTWQPFVFDYNGESIAAISGWADEHSVWLLGFGYKDNSSPLFQNDGTGWRVHWPHKKP